jgi:hypothetical protein
MTQTALSPALDLVRSLSLEEKLELLHSLQAGDAGEVSVVEPAPPTA